ncbi:MULTISPECIES: hypothetical protein [unclassified Novosphingobium]|uniref:hypothetical protein n=1 Tax=unclassified Novosphingobium TaxID=2644732 RepID=UPI00135A7245|nr:MULTISPECIES: hypothetical protein [unclassified Novosphingobium]
MNIKIAALALAASSLALGACATDGYGYGGPYGGVQMGYGSPYAYDGWYDGYYGSIYDGYWGGDNYFYYRSNERDRRYRRADRNHFMRQAPPQGAQGQHRYQQQRGEFRPQQGMHMPQWQGGGAGQGGGERRGQGRRSRP